MRVNANFYRIFYPTKDNKQLYEGYGNPWESGWCGLNTNRCFPSIFRFSLHRSGTHVLEVHQSCNTSFMHRRTR